jgi:hypothetical protein
MPVDNENSNEPSWLHANAPNKREESKFDHPSPSTPLNGSIIKSVTQHDIDIGEINEWDEDCCCCVSDPVLWWFSSFHLISALVALAALVMNIVYLSQNRKHADIRSVLIRVYTILFYLVTVLIEFDWRFLMKRLRIMDLWIVRGLFYSYIGLITVADGTIAAPINIVAVTMMAVGFAYFALGLLCMKQYKMKYVAEKVERRLALSRAEEDIIESV